jgi:cytochrome c oxidase subunit 2
MKNNGRHLAIVAVLVAIGTVITYYVLTAVYRLPVAASSQAGPIDTLFGFHWVAISFLFALIMVFLLYSFVAFRRKPGDEEEGPHVHSNTPLEITWTIIPVVVVVLLGIWAAFILTEITEAQDGEMPVAVRGQQWSWTFSYPDYPDVGPSTRLVLPVDKPIRLEMTSADVLHSFWVPEFRVKQDLVPGQITILRITPTKIGNYKVRCAEICGFDHTHMVSEVEIVSQVDFDQWVVDQSSSIALLSPEERGFEWATEFGCSACHSPDGAVMAGPTWQGVFGIEEKLADGSTIIVDEDYIRKSILNPEIQIVAGFENIPMLSGFEERFTAREAELLELGIEVDIIEDLIAYISSLAE